MLPLRSHEAPAYQTASASTHDHQWDLIVPLEPGVVGSLLGDKLGRSTFAALQLAQEVVRCP
jgi:hypothetical protein